MPVPGQVTDQSAIGTADVTFRSGGDTLTGYLARPREGSAHPGIIVIHEAYGLVDLIKDVARRFASLGYVALAPDLHSRASNLDRSDMQAMMKATSALPDARIVQDLAAAADFVRGQAGTSGKLGCIGFCSGGRQTLLFACSSDKLDAAVDCWGGTIMRANPDALTTPERPVPVIDLVENLSCPLFAAVGAEDKNPSPEDGETLSRRAEPAGKTVVVKVYQGAGHAFFADYRPSYREAPAFALWSDVTAFLDQHLR
jgi:carboxymethylenebutenolidase